ncbi:hypothetical protein FPE01S_01_06510 [Flavihumibacter petaseus NBRC 106054]|uniref:DUF4890 domain-containing protein n=2 Tax=Flavihumibacter TaxID=1004301 RepID=A0A0E9MV56_9BACT|nr:hypothetical protein FPE01S_01_06510 [Flavihumibacter petaseus NBRC 106054]
MLVLMNCLFAPSFLLAQDKQKATPEERAASLTDWMKSKLQLTAEQEPKVKEINLKYAQNNEALKTAPGSKREKMKTLKADEASRDSELKAILTPEQYKIYQDSKAELKQKIKEKRKG